MRIIAEQREALVGRQINLSTQELIALKDKWEEIEKITLAYNKHGAERKMSKQVIEELLPLLEEINNFINQLTDGVMSTSDVHDELFMSERQKELAQAQIEH